MQKLYDAVVKTGEFTNKQGETKGNYENIGTVMQGDNGQFLILKRTFNAAGVPNPDNKDSVIVSFFEPKQQQNNQQQPTQQNYAQQPQSGFNQPQSGYNPQPQQQGFNQNSQQR